MLDELKRLMEEATKGEWEVNSLDHDRDEVEDILIVPKDSIDGFDDEKICTVDCQWTKPGMGKANAALIVAAHNALPALIEVAEAGKECSRQYFYDDCEDYDDVKYDEAMKKLQDALSKLEVKG